MRRSRLPGSIPSPMQKWCGDVTHVSDSRLEPEPAPIPDPVPCPVFGVTTSRRRRSTFPPHLLGHLDLHSSQSVHSLFKYLLRGIGAARERAPGSNLCEHGRAESCDRSSPLFAISREFARILRAFPRIRADIESIPHPPHAHVTAHSPCRIRIPMSAHSVRLPFSQPSLLPPYWPAHPSTRDARAELRSPLRAKHSSFSKRTSARPSTPSIRPCLRRPSRRTPRGCPGRRAS